MERRCTIPSGTVRSLAIVEESAATWTSPRPARWPRHRSTAPATSGPWPSWTSTLTLPGSRPSSRSASARGRSSSSVAEDDRRRPGGPRRARATVGPRSSRGGELARLEHRVEEPAAGQRARVRARPPHRPPAPDRARAASASERVDQRLVGMRRRRRRPARGAASAIAARRRARSRRDQRQSLPAPGLP